MNARTLPRRHFANDFASQSHPGRIGPFFCLLFLLAVVFVPVPFGFGVADVWMPVSHGMALLAGSLVEQSGLDFLVGAFHVPIYLGLYLTISLVMDEALRSMRSNVFRRTVQGLILILILASSFAIMIPYRMPNRPVSRGDFWTVSAHLFNRFVR